MVEATGGVTKLPWCTARTHKFHSWLSYKYQQEHEIDNVIYCFFRVLSGTLSLVQVLVYIQYFLILLKCELLTNHGEKSIQNRNSGITVRSIQKDLTNIFRA